MTDYLSLAARVEGATGPDTKLDTAILRSLGFKYRERQYSIGLTYGKDWDRYTACEWVCGDKVLDRIPAYTASLDAALSLVPEGWVRAVDATVPSLGIDVDLWPAKQTKGEDNAVRGTHELEPLATCAAALRALAADEGGKS